MKRIIDFAIKNNIFHYILLIAVISVSSELDDNNELFYYTNVCLFIPLLIVKFILHILRIKLRKDA